MKIFIKTIILGLIGAALFAMAVLVAKAAIDIAIIIFTSVIWLLKMAAALVAFAGFAVFVIGVVGGATGVFSEASEEETASPQ